MLRIAMCEDDKVFLKYASKIVEKDFLQKGLEIQLHCYGDSTCLMNEITNHNVYDIFFLDIDMPEIDGISLGKILRKTRRKTFIIYLSNKEDLVFQAFETRPFSFIRKSHFEKEISATVDSLCNELKETGTFFCFSAGGITYHWNLEELIYIECTNKILHFHFLDKMVDLYCQMGIMEKELQDFGFIRIHKGFLVNYRYIFSIEKNMVTLDNKEVLPLSKYRCAQVKKEFLNWTT